MKNRGIKQMIICELIGKGFDFEKDVFALSSGESAILSEYAKEVKYKKPKNGYLSTGKHFFLHLQKIFQADRLIQEDLKQK